MLDDTLKCAFCFDLCVRPVTVRATSSRPSVALSSGWACPYLCQISSDKLAKQTSQSVASMCGHSRYLRSC